MRRLLLYFLVLACFSIAHSQSIAVRDWLDYRGVWEGHSHFENRLFLSVDWSNFTTGLQYLAQQPSKLFRETGTDTIKSAIESYWFSLYLKNLEFTAGSFTTILGQGLILNLVRQYNIDIDHHIDGAYLKLKLPSADVVGFSGLARWDDNALVRGGQAVFKPWKLQLGQEYAKIKPKDGKDVELYGTMVACDFDFLSLWAEAGTKKPLWEESPTGYAYYLSTILYISNFTFIGEYKNYKNFVIREKQYNNPPTLIHYSPYTLPSRHVKKVNLNDEVGFAFSASGNKFGMSGEVFFASAARHDGTDKYSQLWLELSKEKKFVDITVAGEYVADKDTTYLTGITDLTLRPEPSPFALTITAEGQQWSYQDAYHRNLYFKFNINYAGFGSIGIEGGVVDEESYIRAVSSIKLIENADMRISLGSRPGGFFCSGGICRYEDRFEGVEVRVILTY